jgi:predicted ATPase
MTIPGGIKEIELSGFKSIKHETLSMNNLNIFIGANGSGKSNFISFFQMIQFYLTNPSGLNEYVGRNGGAEYLTYFGTKNTDTIKARITLQSENGEYKYCVEFGTALGDTLFFKDEWVSYSQYGRSEKNNPISLGSGGKISKLLYIDPEDTEYGKYYNTLNSICVFLNKIRFYQFHDTTRDALIRKAANIDDNTYLRSDGGNLGSFLYMLKQKNPKSYNLILDVVKQIAPFVDDLVLEEDYHSSYIKLKWKETRQNNYHFDVSQMSDGTLRSIALVTVLLQPNLPSVICIDEPELGLHPEAISILADLIKCASEKCQIIIATQSPSLIDFFEPEDIVVVNKCQGETRFERLEYEKYKEWLSEYSLSTAWDTNIFGGRLQR